MIEPAIRYFEVHPIVASADCETRMQIPARILRGTGLYRCGGLRLAGIHKARDMKQELIGINEIQNDE